jgi:chorismate-pyruvate lyase
VTRESGPPHRGLAAALQRSTGTVTEFLEWIAGEPIDADVRAQRTGPAPPDNPLDLSVGADLLHRSVLLVGRATGRAYAYAESVIAVARIPASVRWYLEQSREPIGRVLNDHGLVVRREPLPGPAAAGEPDEAVALLLPRAPITRRYRIVLGPDPAFAVDEWFLETVADVWSRRPTV